MKLLPGQLGTFLSNKNNYWTCNPGEWGGNFNKKKKEKLIYKLQLETTISFVAEQNFKL